MLAPPPATRGVSAGHSFATADRYDLLASSPPNSTGKHTTPRPLGASPFTMPFGIPLRMRQQSLPGKCTPKHLVLAPFEECASRWSCELKLVPF
jgi:hypothetical protein